MHRQGLPLVILALPGFHRVLHQDADVRHVALDLGANFDLFPHA